MNDNKSLENYEATQKAIGYVSRKEAKQSDYDRIGFMSGLEVHQQLLTKRKLFCCCPAGIFQKKNQYDAELIRHMRPTLSESGQYDGTALMEFKTKKEITYRIANKTACTYDVDDTPPFPIDPEALNIAIEISLLSKLKIVGEVHIMRKQYLDGSIPTGFQRTAIIGSDGEITLKNNKKVHLIQLSIEEDSCREVSDIGHKRIYRTDRLGMPLIETVTAPELFNPNELKEACDIIRFLNRSTGKVRTGIGAGREDVNVSCKGGTRVEIKGVAHTKWIPELSHNEAFRQWALMHIAKELNKRCKKKDWKMTYEEVDFGDLKQLAVCAGEQIVKNGSLFVVNLPYFKNILSHFAQPGRPFYDEFTNRLKVIAGIEKPNMVTSEDLQPILSTNYWRAIADVLQSGKDDAQLVFWAEEDDIKMALEVIEERALMAFDGVPSETRKSFADGTTIFERVLPGADRMYPDTDSVPIPLGEEHIETLRKNIPEELMQRYEQLKAWNVPEDTFNYIFTHNYFPLMKRIIDELHVPSKYVGVFFGQKLKHLHGQYGKIPFNLEKIFNLFVSIQKMQLDYRIAPTMLREMFINPRTDYDNAMILPNFKKMSHDAVLAKLKPRLDVPFTPNRSDITSEDRVNCVMGKIRKYCIGNVNPSEIAEVIRNHK